jgi:HAMP domain-containing protein
MIGQVVNMLKPDDTPPISEPLPSAGSGSGTTKAEPERVELQQISSSPAYRCASCSDVAHFDEMPKSKGDLNLMMPGSLTSLIPTSTITSDTISLSKTLNTNSNESEGRSSPISPEKELELLRAQVRDIARVCRAVAMGDLENKITVPVEGPIMSELKEVINSMVDQLGRFAKEVARVATEGESSLGFVCQWTCMSFDKP